MPSLRKKSRVASGSALFVHHKKNSEFNLLGIIQSLLHHRPENSSRAPERRNEKRNKNFSRKRTFFLFFFSRLRRGGDMTGKERRKREKREREKRYPAQHKRHRFRNHRSDASRARREFRYCNKFLSSSPVFSRFFSLSESSSFGSDSKFFFLVITSFDSLWS